ncbi:tryptophan--tRNA ligase 2 [Arthrobacter sp. Hiyo4]|nr:tryptophan--tRNA ligase 2 [Arthrobacter sp. Hiyo4]
MSKTGESPNGSIQLLEDPKLAAKRIKSAVTDTGSEVRFDAEAKPGISNLLTIYSTLTGKSVAELETEYEGKMYGHLKVDLAEIMVDFITPLRNRTNELMADPAELDRLLAQGAERAREIAAVTLARSMSAWASCRPSASQASASSMSAASNVSEGMSVGVILGFPPAIAEELQRWRASFGDPMAGWCPHTSRW